MAPHAGFVWAYIVSLPLKLTSLSMIGDASLLLRFLCSVSSLYESGSEAQSVTSPVFLKHVFAQPSEDTIRKWKPRMRHLNPTHPVASLTQLYANENADVARISVRLPVWFLKHLKSKTSAQHHHDSTTSLSTQDVTSAWVATILSRCDGTPITSITNAASVSVDKVLQESDVDALVASIVMLRHRLSMIMLQGTSFILYVRRLPFGHLLI